MLTVIDEYTRECLAIEAGRQLTANDGLDVLARLFIEYGPPDHVRSDQGAEFTAVRVRAWLAELDVKTAFIEKGSVNADVGRAARELVERHGSKPSSPTGSLSSSHAAEFALRLISDCFISCTRKAPIPTEAMLSVTAWRSPRNGAPCAQYAQDAMVARADQLLRVHCDHGRDLIAWS